MRHEIFNENDGSPKPLLEFELKRKRRQETNYSFDKIAFQRFRLPPMCGPNDQNYRWRLEIFMGRC